MEKRLDFQALDGTRQTLLLKTAHGQIILNRRLQLCFFCYSGSDLQFQVSKGHIYLLMIRQSSNFDGMKTYLIKSVWPCRLHTWRLGYRFTFLSAIGSAPDRLRS